MSETIRLVAGDYAVDSRGRFSYTQSDREKCAQDTACVLLQDVTPDGRWGNQLNTRQSTVMAAGMHKPLIQADVSDAMDRLVSAQAQDSQLGAAEEITRYTVTVQQQPTNLHYAYFVEVKRRNEAQDDPLKKGFVVDLSQARED